MFSEHAQTAVTSWNSGDSSADENDAAPGAAAHSGHHSSGAGSQQHQQQPHHFPFRSPSSGNRIEMAPDGAAIVLIQTHTTPLARFRTSASSSSSSSSSSRSEEHGREAAGNGRGDGSAAAQQDEVENRTGASPLHSALHHSSLQHAANAATLAADTGSVSLTGRVLLKILLKVFTNPVSKQHTYREALDDACQVEAVQGVCSHM